MIFVIVFSPILQFQFNGGESKQFAIEIIEPLTTQKPWITACCCCRFFLPTFCQINQFPFHCSHPLHRLQPSISIFNLEFNLLPFQPYNYDKSFILHVHKLNVQPKTLFLCVSLAEILNWKMEGNCSWTLLVIVSLKPILCSLSRLFVFVGCVCVCVYLF